MTENQDPFDLDRFLRAQSGVYSRALEEIRRGRKETHWMWFIFPQVEGLGSSEFAIFYSIKSIDEARAYLAHPVLGGRLLECSDTVLGIENKTARDVFGHIDSIKLCSSMTLFEAVATKSHRPFSDVLDKYFAGKRDEKTLDILTGWEGLENAV